MKNHSICPICLLEPPDVKVIDDTGDYGEQIIYECARCGKFMITRIACGKLENQNDLNRASLSSWIRMQNEFNKPMPGIRVTDGTLNQILSNLPNYTPSQKQSILLKILTRNSGYPGHRVLLVPRFDYTLAWAINEDELIFHTKSLIKKGLIELAEDDELTKNTLTAFIILTSSGWDYFQHHPSTQDSSEIAPWEPFYKRPSVSGRVKESNWDVFICHASEDKDAFVRPLAHSLREKGLNVWYDEFTLKLGDSLRESIDRGLATSRYGLVILSHHFFSKDWPQRELNGLFATMKAGERRILPIWHDLTAQEVQKYSPIVSDVLAAKSSDGVETVAEKVVEVCRVND